MSRVSDNDQATNII